MKIMIYIWWILLSNPSIYNFIFFVNLDKIHDICKKPGGENITDRIQKAVSDWVRAPLSVLGVCRMDQAL